MFSCWNYTGTTITGRFSSMTKWNTVPGLKTSLSAGLVTRRTKTPDARKASEGAPKLLVNSSGGSIVFKVAVQSAFSR